jgi:hypothetical protein
MEMLSVDLTPDLKEFVESEAQRAGLAKPGDYVRCLIEDAQRRKAIEFLEEMAERALQSGPATEWTPQETVNLKAWLREKFGEICLR